MLEIDDGMTMRVDGDREIRFEDLHGPVDRLSQLLHANASGANRCVPGALSDLINVIFGHRSNLLLAAAPDLLAALEDCADALETAGVYANLVERTRTAITKAGGEHS